MEPTKPNSWRGLNRKTILVIAGLVVVGLVVLLVGLINNQTRGNCAVDDKKVCRFLTQYAKKPNYEQRLARQFQGEGRTQLIILRSVDGGNLSSLKFQTTSVFPTEVVVGHSTLYTKDPEDAKWWRQSYKTQELRDFKDAYLYSLTSPQTTDATKLTYTAKGEDDCSGRKCLRYQVGDPARTNIKHTIWFDKSNYRLLRAQVLAEAGTKEYTFTYNNISVNLPQITKSVPVGQTLYMGSNRLLPAVSP